MVISLPLWLFYAIATLLIVQLITNMFLIIDKHISEKKLNSMAKTAEREYFEDLRKSIEDD